MSQQVPNLTIRQMRIIWRDTFVVEDPPASFLDTCRDRLRKLPCYRADRFSTRENQPPELRVLERVSRNVAGIGYDNLVRFQFADLEIANLRPALDLHRRPPDALTSRQIIDAAQDADDWEAWATITPFLLLHRAGVGIMEYHAAFRVPGGDAAKDPGFTPEEAIEMVRLGISTQLLSLPDAWRAILPTEPVASPSISPIAADQDWHVAVAGLRDLSQIVASGLRAHPGLPGTPRPTGSTSVVLLETDPPATADFPSFVAAHAAPLRGIGAMDTFYHERAAWLVERELADNLSIDSEAAVYLLGNSELILYNDQLGEILPDLARRLRLDTRHAITYLYAHYTTLLEWIYLQDALLRAYIQRLDTLAAAPAPRRREMIAALQGALADLIQYQEDITPFASRIDFLERARRYHKLDRLAERFERKQDLLLSYASEFHDYREARATEFLNWLAGILTGAALADLIITLANITADQTALYLGITLGSIALVLAIMAGLLRQRR